MKSINSDFIKSIPKKVLSACAELRRSGFKAYLAGGCVRDLIMKNEPRDWDIVTDAGLEKIKELFPEHLEIGAAFGIIKLKNKPEEPSIDIAIFRSESGYTDHRHPDNVEAGSEASDIERRDFTCNALYYDTAEKCILDYAGGMLDIELRMIRAVGKPSKRFSEDALRILRAARFSAQLNFKIESETLSAMKKHSSLLSKISRERIRDEVFKVFVSQKAISGMDIMMKTGIWEEVFKVKKSAMPADFRAIKHPETLTALDWLCALGVSCLLGDATKNAGVIVKTVTESLKLSNEEKRVFGKIMGVYHDALSGSGDITEWIEIGKNNRQNFEISRRFIKRARGVSIEDKDKSTKFMEILLRWILSPKTDKIMPSAKQLLSEGFKEGPELGKELRLRQWKAFWKGPA